MKKSAYERLKERNKDIEIGKTPPNNNEDFSWAKIFLSVFIAIVYSITMMSISADGDLSKYYWPVEEFFMNFFIISVIPLLISLPVLLISKDKFPVVLFWTILILSLLSLFITEAAQSGLLYYDPIKY